MITMDIRKRHIVRTLRAAVLLLFVSAFLSRCASMMTPTGGPRDSLPPVIVNMTPDNFSTNRPLVNHEKIYIEFDEFVQLKDQQKEFFTSPQMKKKPLVSLRGRGVVIQLRDTLEANTTYSLNFGSAIRDNNEGNPLYSMRYVFSTGPEIDSMVMSGYTADSYKADSVSKSFIWFFPADSVENVAEYDSTIFKYKPAAIARAENNGIFIAQNLKPIAYRVYAVQDKNDNQIYEPGSDQVGFLEGTYNPREQPDFAMWYDSIRQYVVAEPQLYLRMFTDKAFRRQVLSQSERPLQHKAMLYFAAAHPQIERIRFDSIPEDRVIFDPQTVGRDTIALWFNMPSSALPDTIKGEITYFKHDTVNVLQSVTEPLKLAWRFIETKEQEKEREKLERDRRKAEAAGEDVSAVPHVNGALTIGENIGDLGGLGIALKAYRLALAEAGIESVEEAPVIDGLSALERFFCSWARIWRGRNRDDYAELLLTIDPHSPNEFRCNGIVRNMDAFYEAFDVTGDDALWLAPEKRITIW